MEALLRAGKENIEEVYQRHVVMLYRVAYSFMKNGPDAEDMVQEAFVRLLHSGMTFQSPEHEKAWLIVTVSNLCKSALRSPWQRRTGLDDMAEPPAAADATPDETLEAVLALPEDYKLPVYLFYYEGYPTAEIRPDAGRGPGNRPQPPEPGKKKTETDLGR